MPWWSTGFGLVRSAKGSYATVRLCSVAQTCESRWIARARGRVAGRPADEEIAAFICARRHVPERSVSTVRFVLASFGTRGDIEPCAALGRELLRRGHDVRIAVPPDLVAFAESTGLAAV